MTSKRDSVGSESGESRRGSPSEEPERASEEAIASTETLSDAEPDQASAHGSDQEHDSDVTEASQRAHGPSRVFRDQTDQQTALMNQSRTEKANPKVEQIHSMPGRYDRLVGDFWTSEMLGVVISVGTIIGIVSILFSFRNGSTNHLMKGVTVSYACELQVSSNIVPAQHSNIYTCKSFSSCNRFCYRLCHQSAKMASIRTEASKSLRSRTL